MLSFRSNHEASDIWSHNLTAYINLKIFPLDIEYENLLFVTLSAFVSLDRLSISLVVWLIRLLGTMNHFTSYINY